MIKLSAQQQVLH